MLLVDISTGPHKKSPKLIKYQASCLLRLRERVGPSHQASSGCIVLCTVEKHSVSLSYKPHLLEPMNYIFLLPLAITLVTFSLSSEGLRGNLKLCVSFK